MSEQIRTAEELEALPEGTVVLDARRIAWQRIEDFDNGPLHWHSGYGTVDLVDLPAAVLTPVQQIAALDGATSTEWRAAE